MFEILSGVHMADVPSVRYLSATQSSYWHLTIQMQTMQTGQWM